MFQIHKTHLQDKKIQNKNKNIRTKYPDKINKVKELQKLKKHIKMLGGTTRDVVNNGGKSVANLMVLDLKLIASLFLLILIASFMRCFLSLDFKETILTLLKLNSWFLDVEW